MIKTDYNSSSYQNAIPGYSESQKSTIRPFYHSDFRESLEKIVLKNEPSKGEGVLERVFTEKTKNQKATIRALFQEIELREKLNAHLLNNIDKEICRQHGYLSQFNTGYATYPIDPTNDLTTKTQLENNVLELDKEKRKEYLDCWNDLMALKRYLFGALKDYWDLSKRKQALTYDLNSLKENEIVKRG